MANTTAPIMTDATGMKIYNALSGLNIAPATNRNLGELIFSSIPLVDAGLHLADGNEVSSATYADFFNYIKSLALTGNVAVDTVTTTGVGHSSVDDYGKYIYNSTDNKIYFPNLNGMFIEGTSSASDVGNYIAPGLPNITGSVQDFSYTAFSQTGAHQSGALSSSTTSMQGQTSEWSTGTLALRSISFSASNSDTVGAEVYGNSDTVQPPAVKQYIYIVVANAYKPPVYVDIDEVMTDVNEIKSKYQPTLLWTNSDPDSAFTTQTVRFSGSWNFYLIVYYRKSGSTSHPYLGWVKSGFKGPMDLSIWGGKLINRSIGNTTTTSITFNSGYIYNTYGIDGTQDDNYAIPYQVYGVW